MVLFVGLSHDIHCFWHEVFYRFIWQIDKQYTRHIHALKQNIRTFFSSSSSRIHLSFSRNHFWETELVLLIWQFCRRMTERIVRNSKQNELRMTLSMNEYRKQHSINISKCNLKNNGV